MIYSGEINYEKLYKDALERAKKIDIDEAYASQGTIAKTIFPELAESEDERIRKGLVEALKTSKTVGELKFTLPEPTREECITYLEKQKEQKPVKSDTEKEYVRILKSIVSDFIRDKKPKDTLLYQDIFDWLDGRHIEQKSQNITLSREDCLHQLFENGTITMADYLYLTTNRREQKPVEKQDYSGLNDLERAILRGFLAAGMDNVPVTVIKETAKECLAQMKPAEWSDTDNIGWDEAFACVTEAEKSAKNEEELQNAVTAEKWLKEIKFKYYVHPVKQEWNEFNRDCLKRAIWYVENPAPTVVKDTNLVLWLQSLPERFNLQPKEEWSEEDKQDFDDLIMRFEKSLRINRCYFTPYDVDWLKSKFDGNSCK